MELKLSIIIPVYNSAPYLRASLDSICNQTFQDWECICVDDGSTDGSGAILDECAAKDNRFKVFHQANRGVSATRQRGLELARGEYVGWVDSDDIIEPSHFENLYRKIEKSKADLVWCGYVEERDGVRSVCLMPCEESAQAMLEGILTCCVMGFLVSKLFRRSKILKSGARFPQHCQIMEDSYFLVGFLLANPILKHIPEATYHYLVRSQSLSNQGGSATWWEKVIDSDKDICSLVQGSVKPNVLKVRWAMLKSMLLFSWNVPDEMFYRFHPEIRRLPQCVAGWLQRVQFGVANVRLRWLIRLVWSAKRRLRSVLSY